MGVNRKCAALLCLSVFVLQCLFSSNIYDFGLMENDIKLQHLLLQDNVLTNLYTKTDLKDPSLDKIVHSCSLSQRQGNILHPLDAFCLIKKYSKNFSKIVESQPMLENQTTKGFEPLSESTYNKAICALGLMLKHFKGQGLVWFVLNFG